MARAPEQTPGPQLLHPVCPSRPHTHTPGSPAQGQSWHLGSWEPRHTSAQDREETLSPASPRAHCPASGLWARPPGRRPPWSPWPSLSGAASGSLPEGPPGPDRVPTPRPQSSTQHRAWLDVSISQAGTEGAGSMGQGQGAGDGRTAVQGWSLPSSAPSLPGPVASPVPGLQASSWRPCPVPGPRGPEGGSSRLPSPVPATFSLSVPS